MTSSREEICGIFVEGDSEDSIGVVESFLNSISVMNIDIDIKYSSMYSTGGRVSELLVLTARVLTSIIPRLLARYRSRNRIHSLPSF